MSKYRHLFFDLDHTLWDYDTNAAEALTELHQKHGIESRSGITAEQLIQTFLEVNDILWDDFNLSRINRDDIRSRRFPMIYEILSASLNDIPLNIEVEYVELAPTKRTTFPFAHEVLGHLAEQHQLHLITNGFDDIQSTKLESSDLTNYFDVIVTSETAGFRKPEAEIFEFALNKAGADKAECLMIGDSLVADIGGARNFGIDQVFFNPNEKPHSQEVTYEIKGLKELVELL